MTRTCLWTTPGRASTTPRPSAFRPPWARRWRAPLGDGGSAHPGLWTAVLDARGRQLPLLPVVEDLPAPVDPAACAATAQVMARVLADEPGARVALALARPGPSGATADDAAWARELRTAHGRVGLPLLSVHLVVRAAVRPPR